MRYMLFMIPNIPTDEWMPDAETVGAMTRYNEEITKAGVLLSADGLLSDAEGARVTYPGGTPVVKDGPFTEAKEIVGGYWIIEVKSKEEAVEWAKRVPGSPDNIVEVRRIAELTDFPDDVREAAGYE